MLGEFYNVKAAGALNAVMYGSVRERPTCIHPIALMITIIHGASLLGRLLQRQQG